MSPDFQPVIDRLESGRRRGFLGIGVEALTSGVLASAAGFTVATLVQNRTSAGPDPAVAAVAAALVTAVVAFALRAFLDPPDLIRLSQRADRVFDLDERVSTALELERGERSAIGPVGRELLRETASRGVAIDPRRLSPIGLPRWWPVVLVLAGLGLAASLLPREPEGRSAPDPETPLGARERGAAAGQLHRIAQLIEEDAGRTADPYLGAVARTIEDLAMRLDRSGVLRVCVPSDYPPLVTTDPERPGVDVEVLSEIARRMEVRLALNVNSSIGRDFNPRNWRVTRGQCQVLAGGVVVSITTRSFLDTTPPHLETGWAMVAPTLPESLEGQSMGVYAGLTGLDRLGLSRYLRAEGARLVVIDSAEALAEAIASGTVAAGISEALTAGQLAGANGWAIAWLPPPIERYPIAFGLWKGDLTLKRKIAEILNDLHDEGFLAALAQKYGILPIEETFEPASAAAPGA